MSSSPLRITPDSTDNYKTLGFDVEQQSLTPDPDESEPPNTQGYKQTFQAKPYPFSWIFTFMFWVSLLGFGVTIVIYGFDSLPTLIFLGASILSICLYGSNSALSSTLRFLSKKRDTAFSVQYIEQMQLAAPQISFYIECYHFETKTRESTRYVTDSNGRTRTETYTETYTEIEVTHTAMEEYKYRSWKDVSEDFNITGLNDYAFTRLECERDWRCANDETEQDLNMEKEAFFAENTSDTYQNKMVRMFLQDHRYGRGHFGRNEMLIKKEPGGPKYKFIASGLGSCKTKEMLIESQPGGHKCISSVWYMVFMCLGCSACYRLHFNTLTQRMKYTFMKEISI